MRKPATATILFLLLAGGLGSTAQAVNCGAGITSSVTLTSDLNCTSHYAAIEVFADNVTIDLNGYTLSGTADMSGIHLNGFDNLTVKNGSIRGFFAGVNANRTTSLTVKDVLFYEVGSGVTSNAINKASIKQNQFVRTAHGISIRNAEAGTSSNDNVISNNEFYQANVGIHICGDRADSNVIAHNLIWKTADYGIHIVQSDKNQIFGNRILETGDSAIRLRNSSYANIKANTLKEGRIGLDILANANSSCLSSGSQQSVKNDVTVNHAAEFEIGVQMGLGIHTSAQVLRNDLSENKLYDNDVGIYFHSDAHRNTSSDAYQGTITPIVDDGVNNTY